MEDDVVSRRLKPHEVETLQRKHAQCMSTLDAVRKAYLRDVVSIKEELRMGLGTALSKSRGAGKAKENAFAELDPSTITHVNLLPSADLSGCLALRSPEEFTLTVHPCKKCSGVLALIDTHHEQMRLSKHAVMYQSENESLRDTTRELKKQLADTKNKLDRAETELQHTLESKIGTEWLDRRYDTKLKELTELLKCKDEQIAAQRSEIVKVKEDMFTLRQEHERILLSQGTEHVPREKFDALRDELSHSKTWLQEWQFRCGESEKELADTQTQLNASLAREQSLQDRKSVV